MSDEGKVICEKADMCNMICEHRRPHNFIGKTPCDANEICGAGICHQTNWLVKCVPVGKEAWK